jgi:uncharacterized protein (DUF488 family)
LSRSPAQDPGSVIYTLGHSDRSAEAFLALLKKAEVSHVVDVRSAPWSRRHPWHAKPELEASCRAAGLDYTWLGPQLGGLREEGYALHQRSDSYREGLETLVALAKNSRVAIVCAEREPGHCHRRFIADDLVRQGLIVRHMIDETLVLPHQIPLL